MEKLNVLRVPIDKLHPDPSNVRKHGEKNLTAIKASLLRFGQQKPIVIDAKHIVRAGNGTLEAAKTLGWSHIDCVQSDLVGSELTAFAIADNRTAELAEWDDDALAKQLLALEDEGFGLDNMGFDADFSGNDENSDKSNEYYSKNIVPPIHTPTGPKPNLIDCFDRTKSDFLIEKINKAKNISKEEKEFLKFAAYRHIKFNFENIAEYFAQSNDDMKHEMEDSALVLIDFEKAIENGFVKLADDMKDAYLSEKFDETDELDI